MLAFGEAFYGRSAAYDLALTDSREALAQAFCKNILDGEDIDNARHLAGYAEAVIAGLDSINDSALLAASWTFPSPLCLTEHAHD
jgi:cytochrome b pre-mRNA-processing protein 3